MQFVGVEVVAAIDASDDDDDAEISAGSRGGISIQLHATWMNSDIVASADFLILKCLEFAKCLRIIFHSPLLPHRNCS